MRRARLGALLGLAALACGPAREPEPPPPSIAHLTQRLAEASVESAESPASSRRELRWDAADLREDWAAFAPEADTQLSPVALEASEQALALALLPPPHAAIPLRVGGIAVELAAQRLADWETVLVRARSRDRFAGITATYNLREEGALPTLMRFFLSTDEAPPVFNDGSVQTYAIPLPRREGAGADTPLRSLAVFFGAPGAARVELLSVALVPRGAAFAEPVGARPVTRGGTTRDTLYAHANAVLGFAVDLEGPARLDVGLAVNPGEVVTYRVRTGPRERGRLLFQETIDAPDTWHQRSVDLSALAGRGVRLWLEAESAQPGAVALWGAPIVAAGPRPAERPNVIFYVIDGGGADLMSAFGYERPTTPFLEELAREGVLFTRAYSNSTWTQPSTVSFMTSLQHSVLGGLRRGVHSTAVPAEAVPMAEHFRRAGYLTVSLTSNPNAGRIIGIERGVDLLRDGETEHHSTSSTELHDRFWRFRSQYRGEPYWAHFQTTDVHEPNEPHEPFAGRFASAERRAQLDVWDARLRRESGAAFGTTSIAGHYDLALERTGIDRQAYFGTRRDLYDETMLYQDEALRRFVAELRARGEWEHTLLVIGSDHGHPAGTFARFGRGLFDPQPEPWQGALFDAYATRIPLLVVWPGRIEGGRSFSEPVSMIDVLPTVLELAGLPAPEVLQGQSLAPLLRGEPMDVRPVILDEFRVDEATGEMIGNLEIVDGRWGASLEIGPAPGQAGPEAGRRSVPAGGRWGAVHPFFPDVPRLLLYDLEADPFARRAVNDEHPERVAHYRRVLTEQWRAHRALAERFTEAEETPLTPEQLEQLRTLGYIQ